MTCSKRFFLLNKENSLKVKVEKARTTHPLLPRYKFCQDTEKNMLYNHVSLGNLIEQLSYVSTLYELPAFL
jgi:hypothetical protein